MIRLLFGLKWKRFKEWREVLEEEGRWMKWKDWWHMLDQTAKSILTPVGKNLYRHRLLTCQRCPIYDKGLKRCRPYTGSNLGCGCFVPYRAKTPEPCWLRLRDPHQGWD